jgi:hypothetical protein
MWHQKFNTPSPAKVFCVFGDLPHIATTAVTATLGRISRAIRIRSQIWNSLRTGVAGPCTVVAFKRMNRIKFAFNAFKVKKYHANHSKFNASTPNTLKATFDPLPHVATTAVTDRSCEIRRATRICSQIENTTRTGVARPCTVVATKGIRRLN